MNWIQIILNVIGAAAAGGASAYQVAPTVHGALMGALGAVAANLAALFQKQPHNG